MGRDAYDDVMRRFGDWNIEKLRVARRPLVGYQEAFAQGAQALGGTRGKHVDKFFHTYAEMALRHPTTGERHVVMLEKNQTLNAIHSRPGGIPESHDGFNVDIGKWGGKRSLAEYEARHRKHFEEVVNKPFDKYSVRDNNCQIWQRGGLAANGVDSEKAAAFTSQPLSEVLPLWFGKFLQPITDLGAKVDAAKDAVRQWWSGKKPLAKTPISDHIKPPADVEHLSPPVYQQDSSAPTALPA